MDPSQRISPKNQPKTFQGFSQWTITARVGRIEYILACSHWVMSFPKKGQFLFHNQGKREQWKINQNKSRLSFDYIALVIPFPRSFSIAGKKGIMLCTAVLLVRLLRIIDCKKAQKNNVLIDQSGAAIGSVDCWQFSLPVLTRALFIIRFLIFAMCLEILHQKQ